MRKLLVLALAAIAAALVAVSGATAESARPAAKPNLVQTAAKAGQFKTLVALVKKAGLAGTLAGKGPYTVFAPTDAAFNKVPKKTLDALAKDKAKLKAVLLYHVVKGRVTASQVVKLKSAATLEGSRVSIKVKNGSVYVGGAKVTTADVTASNGVIHVINKVLIPTS